MSSMNVVERMGSATDSCVAFNGLCIGNGFIYLYFNQWFIQINGFHKYLYVFAIMIVDKCEIAIKCAISIQYNFIIIETY